MLSVGIVGATGYMGAPFSRALLKASRKGLLRFVILHRPASDLTRYPNDVELRQIDLEQGDVASNAEKMKDLQVVMYVSAAHHGFKVSWVIVGSNQYLCKQNSNSSATSWRADEAQYPLIDALKGSKELITFFPSEYATPHSAEALASPLLAHSNMKNKVREHCETQGVPYTVLANATTPELLFNFK
jgi:hypothetical protein